MRINKKCQYALLFALYLNRAGKSNGETISEELGIPKAFLFQIANDLRKAGIVESEKGVGGGYSLKKDPTVLDVLTAAGFEPALTVQETRRYMRGPAELRAFAAFVGHMTRTTLTALGVRVSQLNKNLARGERLQLESVSPARTV